MWHVGELVAMSSFILEHLTLVKLRRLKITMLTLRPKSSRVSQKLGGMPLQPSLLTLKYIHNFNGKLIHT